MARRTKGQIDKSVEERVQRIIARSQTIANWQAAYEAANGKPAPEVKYRNGWYAVEGMFQKWRQSDIERLTQNLERRDA